MEKIKYRSLNSYCREIFGHKVYKIAIDGGFTCPNRDGTVSYGGCAFCSQAGSGDFAQSRDKFITQQIEDGKGKVESKMGAQPGQTQPSYIAYFQAYTNTYGPVEELRAKYLEAINHPDVCAISIATRPDCLPEDVVALLHELNKIKPVWVELGLQTIHPITAKLINRGYDLPVYDQAVRDLKGLNIITHVILGLPGESKQDMLDTVSYVVNSGVSGIKLQLLHIIEGTLFHKMYEEGQIQTLDMDEYIEIVGECLEIIPRDMVVHRLTGDGDKKTLVAPMWSANKRAVLNEMNKRFEPYGIPTN